TATPGQANGAQVFDFVHETEGAGPAHLLDEGGAGKVHTGIEGFTGERRVVEIDGKVDAIAVAGLEGGVLVAVPDGDFLEDTDEFLGGILLDDAGRLNQEHKRGRTAIHDGHFRG